jgi:hypothetical protein
MRSDDNEKRCVVVTVIVTVHVDPDDDELLERSSESSSTLSVDEIVRAEIESNLESVSYVRCVSVEGIERR